MKNKFWQIVREKTSTMQKELETIAKKYAGQPIDNLLKDEEYRRINFAQNELNSMAYELAETLFGLDD